MAMAILRTRKILKRVRYRELEKPWKLLIGLLLFICASYVFYIYLIYNEIHNWRLIFSGALFMAGAYYIYLVLNHS